MKRGVKIIIIKKKGIFSSTTEDFRVPDVMSEQWAKSSIKPCTPPQTVKGQDNV